MRASARHLAFVATPPPGPARAERAPGLHLLAPSSPPLPLQGGRHSTVRSRPSAKMPQVHKNKIGKKTKQNEKNPTKTTTETVSRLLGAPPRRPPSAPSHGASQLSPAAGEGPRLPRNLSSLTPLGSCFYWGCQGPRSPLPVRGQGSSEPMCSTSIGLGGGWG